MFHRTASDMEMSNTFIWMIKTAVSQPKESLRRSPLSSCFLCFPAWYPSCNVFSWHPNILSTPVPLELPSVVVPSDNCFSSICLQYQVYIFKWSLMLLPCSVSIFFRTFLITTGHGDSLMSLYLLLSLIWPINTAEQNLGSCRFAQTPDPGQKCAASTPPSYGEPDGFLEGKMCVQIHPSHRCLCFFRLKPEGYDYLTTIIHYLTFLVFSENRYNH